MLYRKVDFETGMFIEDVILDEHPHRMQDGEVILDENGAPVLAEEYVEVEVPQGFYHPKWDFVNNVWVEGGIPPEAAATELTLEERVAATEAAILEIMLGGVA